MQFGVAPEAGAQGRASDPAVMMRVAHAVSRSSGYFAVLVDSGLTVKWASETVEAVLGWPDVVGMNVIGLIHPDDVELALMGIMHHTANADAYASQDRGWTIEPVTVRLQHADGHFVQVQVTLVNHLSDPDIDGLFGICHRVVDRSDMELAIDLLGRNAPIDDVMPVIARFVDRTSDGRRCQLIWWQDDEMKMVAADGGAALPTPPLDIIELTRVTSEAHEVMASDASASFGAQIFSSGYRALWTTPVLAPQGGDVLGVMAVWGQVEFDLILKHADHPAMRLASLAMADHRSKSSLRWEASHDSLTRVHNRAGFAAALAATDQPCALLCLDLDDFKPVNDRFGHEGGDRMLLRAAERISRSVRQIDVVARLGGDEFAVICPDVTPEGAIEIARRISRAVSRPVRIAGEPVRVGVSVGIAAKRCAGDASGLLRRADEALYRAKADGKRRIAVAEPGPMPPPGSLSR